MVKILSSDQRFSYIHSILISSLIAMVVVLYGMICFEYNHKNFKKSFYETRMIENNKHKFAETNIAQIQLHNFLNEEKDQNFFNAIISDKSSVMSKPVKYDHYFPAYEQEMEFSRNCPMKFSANLSQVMHISNRKELFISNLLPSILAYNEEVQADRDHLIILKEIKDNGHYLSVFQTNWLNQLAIKYKLQRVNMSELLKRVDIIPPSLALGQAVMETGWGGSLAAQGFNSPFGMMKTHKHVFSYSSLQESVNHYIHNLNTHEAYKTMRIKRAALRGLNEKLCSLQLAEGLSRYSILGKTYIHRVQNIITSFKLQKYDKARLTPFVQSS